MSKDNEDLRIFATAIRTLSADMIEKAKSGHPGGPLGLADLAAVLWLKFLKFDPQDLHWDDRDRFVLSGGHCSALLYSLLHFSGAGLSMDDIKQFRQFGSKCPGHPERGVTPGVEVTTGPLGQGFAMAVGMAAAERMSAARYNAAGAEPLVDHNTWCFCGDGDMQEGISHEAAALAGVLKLSRLIVVYDSNGITIEGSTAISSCENTKKRFEAYGWRVLEIDGHDFDAINRAYRKALAVNDAPVLIIAKTHIGFGAPTKQDSESAHGSPLGEAEIKGLKEKLGCDPAAQFCVPDEVYEIAQRRARAMHRIRNKWRKTLSEYEQSQPALFAAYRDASSRTIPKDLSSSLPSYEESKSFATRSVSGDVMSAIASRLPYFVGGSADLGPSTKTVLKGKEFISADNFAGSNFHFGIRELAMAAIVNGIAAHGGYIPFGATFFVFSDYCRPAIRLAAIMELPSIFVFSHDSFHVGEDGPTHEPVEQLAALRCMPNVLVLRPADPNEMASAWLAALSNTRGPTCILTTRQNVPVLPANREGALKGGYTVFDAGDDTPDKILFISSGSEVSLCIEAAKVLVSEGKAARVVSMMSRELFAMQSPAYRESVIPTVMTRRVVVEAQSHFGWEAFAENPSTTRYVTMDGFGASAPSNILAVKFGFTVENVLKVARPLAG